VPVSQESQVSPATRASKFVCPFQQCTTEPNFPIYTPKSGLLTSCICICKRSFVFVYVAPLCAHMYTGCSESDSEVFRAQLLVLTSKSNALISCNCLCRRSVRVRAFTYERHRMSANESLISSDSSPCLYTPIGTSRLAYLLM